MPDIDDLINERQKVHGPFLDYADVDQGLKSALPRDFRETTPPYISAGLDMIFSKIARIATGDPTEIDHWQDIQGYSRAVQRCLPDFELEIPEKPGTLEKPEKPETLEKPEQNKVPGKPYHHQVYSDIIMETNDSEHQPCQSCCCEEQPLPNLAFPKIVTYRDIKVETLDANRLCPGKNFPSQGEMDRKKIKLACDLTMKKVGEHYDFKEATEQLISNLYDAEHHSIFEHCNITFLASGISRSLLAQITRQGTFRFTSASQQYQDYRNYAMTLRPGWDNNHDIAELYKVALHFGLKYYIKLIEAGEKPEEARQVLPPAATVNLQITANARNIARFLRVRLCKRNVNEMEVFTWRLRNECMKWLPELFGKIHAPCAMDGRCNQGKMTCGKPFAAMV